ncbi:MAG: TIGR00725 family protein [Solirubrobacterales bacterium]
MTARRRQVSVIGASQAEDELLANAEAVGRGLAEAGLTLVCGGLGGVMEAASRGATEAGGEAIGIIPWDDPAQANPHVTHVVATGIGYARNLAVVASGDAVVAVGGTWGTLSEIAFARNLGRPVVALDSWPLRSRDEVELGIVVVETPEAAVAAVLEALQ